MGVVVSLFALDAALSTRVLHAMATAESVASAAGSSFIRRLLGSVPKPDFAFDEFVYREFFDDAVQENWDTPDRSTDVDKAWDVIQRSLDLLIDRGMLQSVAKGMLSGEGRRWSEHVPSLKALTQVAKTSEAISDVSLEQFLSVRSDACRDAYIGDVVDDDEGIQDYVFPHFDQARSLYQKAARRSDSILVLMQ